MASVITNVQSCAITFIVLHVTNQILPEENPENKTKVLSSLFQIQCNYLMKTSYRINCFNQQILRKFCDSCD